MLQIKGTEDGIDETSARITGFDNISVIDKYKIPIDSVEYSMPEIARETINIIKNNKKDSVIVKHSLIERTI